MPKRSLSELVLDTIDTISARKNRPNLVRIYRHLNRLYDLSLTTCESLINSLLKEGRVIRVTYKGNISYRNAQKWKRYSYYMKRNMGSNLPSTIITNAISELVVQEPDYLHMGVPCNILEQHLISMHNDNINKEAIHKLLQRELKLESLLQLDNGNYFLGPKPTETTTFEDFDVDMSSERTKEVTKPKLNNPDLSGAKMLSGSNNCLELNEKEESNSSKPDSDSDKCVQNECISVEVDGSSYNVTVHTKGTSNSVDEEKGSMESAEEHKSSYKNGDTNTLNGIIDKFSSHNISADTDVINEFKNGNIVKSKCPYVSKYGDSIEGNCSFDRETGSNEIEGVNHNSSDSNDNMDSFSVNEIIGVGHNETRKNSEITSSLPINSTSPINSDNDMNTSKTTPDSYTSTSEKQSDIEEEEEEEKDMKITPLIAERVQRKKKRKYDASDYYFPSLKRKSRDTVQENDKKEDKRKKKKKKKDTGNSGLGQVFSKRVMFPGNSNMCCECNCYTSRIKLDPMVFCTTCSNQGHQSCTSKTINGKDWYCVYCRQDLEVCTICKKVSLEKEKEVLYTCSSCGERYHKGCHNPVIKLPFSTTWHCFSCPSVEDNSSNKGHPKATENNKNNSAPSPTNKENTEECNDKLRYLKEEPPDCTNWTCTDVYEYFMRFFDKTVAQTFLDQDIDGYALKLLERSDVLKFDHNLGINLRLLVHIRRLQLRTNNLSDIWKS